MDAKFCFAKCRLRSYKLRLNFAALVDNDLILQVRLRSRYAWIVIVWRYIMKDII